MTKKEFYSLQKADFLKRYNVLKESGLKRNEAYNVISEQENLSISTVGAILHSKSYRNSSLKVN
jgi:DNA-binding phage protein